MIMVDRVTIIDDSSLNRVMSRPFTRPQVVATARHRSIAGTMGTPAL
jgi:hypothetical protein